MALEGRAKKKDIPEGLWLKCPGCKEMVYRKRVEENLHVCPECQYHFKIGARQRISLLADADSFEESFANLMSPDPLGFVDRKTYVERLADAQRQTNLYDAAIVGRAYVKGRPVILVLLTPTSSWAPWAPSSARRSPAPSRKRWNSDSPSSFPAPRAVHA